MTKDASLDLRRFYIKAAVVIVLLAALSGTKMPRDFVAGVLAGGALAIINIRGMSKGVRALLQMDRPSAARMLFSGIFRLLMLSAVIVIIAMLHTVDLLGLLMGFAVVPLLLTMEGLRFARTHYGDDVDTQSASACKTRQKR